MRPKAPLFFKLALVFMISCLAVISAVSVTLLPLMPHTRRAGASMQSNMLFHVNDLADRIGDPPDTTRAAALAAELGLRIRVEGRSGSWASEPGMPGLSAFKGRDHEGLPPGVTTGRQDGSFFVSLARGDTRYLFVFPGNPAPGMPLRAGMLLAGLILLILFMSYATVTWLLKPLIRAKERLLLDVSHELRSPLTRIKVALEMVPPSAHVAGIARASSEMETMLSEILESQRLQSSHGALSRSPVFLPQLAREIAANYKGVRVIQPLAFPSLQLDASKVGIVLRNAIDNALKYSEGQKRAVELSFGEDGNGAWVRVRDHGVGLPKEELETVFEPFYRVDKSRAKKTGGYGLGLSLCRQIMRAHGGDARLESAGPGKGSTLILTFPKP